MAEDLSPYSILERKRDGLTLSESAIRTFVTGSTDGTWDDSQISAFLMAVTIRGLDAEETRNLTVAMLESGERWNLGAEVPGVVDKHSTGGVGDKVSLVLAPLLAVCGVPIAKLTGRGLGHTGGTADKLETIPGIDLGVGRERAIRLLENVGMVVATASAEVAPADKRIYALRNVTATVESLPLIVSSILSKKLAVGATNLVFDVKTGNGAFFVDQEPAVALASLLVRTAESLGTGATAVVTDMSQPLGRWAGNACEIAEVLECLEGRGEERLLQVVLTIAEELLRSVARPKSREDLESVLRSGEPREKFLAWAAAQGAETSWLRRPTFQLPEHEVVARVETAGFVSRVDTRRLGLVLLRAGAGRSRAGDTVDGDVSMRYSTCLGSSVEPGQELARLYLRRPDAGLEASFRACFEIAAEGTAPLLIRQRISS